MSEHHHDHGDSEASDEHEEHVDMAEVEETEESSETSHTKTPKHAAVHGKLKNWWQWMLDHKKVSFPAAAVVLVLLLAAIPMTRYALAGMVLKKDLQVVVLDAESNTPVTSASVSFHGKTVLTDSQGKAKVHAKVGSGELTVKKQYYKPVAQKATLKIGNTQPVVVNFTALGRAVPVVVLNKISGQAVKGATVEAEKSKVLTDKDGKATIILPPNKETVTGTVSGEGYNNNDVTLAVTTKADPANTFALTPAGKIYFLSNASGKVDLVKSDLDGSNRQTTLAGTGKEDKFGTILLASRDWKYIALLSKRDGGDYPKLFLIETDTGKVTTMDEGKADFDVLGWSDNRFVYKVVRRNIDSWLPKTQALKSYDVVSKKITLLDENQAEGTPQTNDNVTEYFGEVYILGQEIVYTKNWNAYYNTINYQTKKATFNSVFADGSHKKVVKTYQLGQKTVETRTSEFGEVYIQGVLGVDAYLDGKLTTTHLTSDEYYNSSYPVYSVSPSGKKTLWSEYRDGKNVFFVGDGAGKEGKRIGESQDFAVYGWYSDDYILLTRKGSELHIMPADGPLQTVDTSLKVTDYYKPDYYNRGFGYGYGG